MLRSSAASWRMSDEARVLKEAKEEEDAATSSSAAASPRSFTLFALPEEGERAGLLQNGACTKSASSVARVDRGTRDSLSTRDLAKAHPMRPPRNFPCTSCCLKLAALAVLGLASALAVYWVCLLVLGRRHVQIAAAKWPQPAPSPAPRPALPPPRRGICSLTAPIRKSRPLRSWRIGPGWMRTCEMKNRHGALPVERNWCWDAVKASCHLNLKRHYSWQTLRDMAASWGDAPPRSAEPFEPLENASICDDPFRGRKRKWTAEERAEARTWFRDNVAVYVLGLLSDMERWAEISKRLTELHIWATRVPGVDMRKPGAIDVAKENGWVPWDFNFTHAQEVAYRPEHSMGSILGTLGCATAHFKAQTKVIADGVPLAVVFEDDSWPEEDFVERLWSLVHDELPCDWEVTTLYSRCPYGRCVSEHLSRVEPDANEPAYRCRHGVNWGMQAVVYRTEVLPRVQQLWKQTVFHEEWPHCMDIDVALASISDKVGFYAVPAVQDPGFLRETNHPSMRWNINMAGQHLKHPH